MIANYIPMAWQTALKKYPFLRQTQVQKQQKHCGKTTERMIQVAVNSKQKGARFERLLASRFRDEGYDARRTAQYCGNTGDAADVIGLPGIHIEAKHQERMRLYEWMAQAKMDAQGTGKFPAVFHKANNCEILVTMELNDWMQIYREWEAGMDFDRKDS